MTRFIILVAGGLIAAAIPAHPQAVEGPVPAMRADCDTTRTTIIKEESTEFFSGDSEAFQERRQITRVYCRGTQA